MSEFVNVTEVEKLPLDRIDSLIAIDADKNIKRTFITVDHEIDADSTNPISSKGVFDALEELRGDVGAAVEELETQIETLDDDITDIRDEIITLNDSLDDYYTKNLLYTKPEINEMISGLAPFEFVNDLIGDINTVLDQINGEEV